VQGKRVNTDGSGSNIAWKPARRTVRGQIGDGARNVRESLGGGVAFEALHERLDALATEQARLELVVAQRQVRERFCRVFPDVLVLLHEEKVSQDVKAALLVLEEARLVAL